MYQVDRRSKLFRYVNAAIDIRLSGLDTWDILSIDEIYFMDYLDFRNHGGNSVGFKYSSHHLYIYGNKIQDHHLTIYNVLRSYFESRGTKVIDGKILSLCYITLVLFQYSIDVTFFLKYMDENEWFDVRDFIDSYISFILD